MKKLTRIYAIELKESVNESSIAIGVINYKVYMTLIRCMGVTSYNVIRIDLQRQFNSEKVIEHIVVVNDHKVYKSARELYKLIATK